MCGIVGLSLQASHPNAPLVVAEMSEGILHRGPDSSGAWQSPKGKTHLGFRRLAIRDLDARANQPMVSSSGKTAIVFNGEVYNSKELAAKYLGDHELRTTGDTEVVLELIEKLGTSVVPELNGMFALAMADVASDRITLARDRMGKKPLYLYESDRLIGFSSELRSLKPFGLTPDPENAELFTHFGYFPSPFTFYQNTTQVRPGEIVVLAAGDIVARESFHRFTDQPWGHADIPLKELDALFRDSVRLRKLSDVSLGAFLSGGVDSALVAAYLGDGAATNISAEATPTFTVAFAEQAHNEAHHAAETAHELAVPNVEIKIEEENLANLASEYIDCYEQPYADTSGLVTMLLCKAVKQHVTVALSGDGGDEFFGGYARYSWFRKALAAQRAPTFARKLASLGISRLDGRRGQRLARWLNARDPAELYYEVIRNWNAADTDTLLDKSLRSRESRAHQLVREVFDQTDGDALSAAACFDATYYIPDDLQVKLDRASMRVALEVRCPLLDYRIANYGIALNSQAKYRDGLKSTLKRLLSHHVSDSVLNRPKHGFNVPLARWLQGPMRTMVSDTLNQRVVNETGWINGTTARRVWTEFVEGKTHYAHNAWMLFNLAHHLHPTRTDPLFASLTDAPLKRIAA